MTVRIGDAKAIARQWVLEEASGLPGFVGAYVAGSAAWLPDDALLPATSDLDVNVVLADATEARSRGKLVYRGALLEASYLSTDQLASPEQVLSDYHLAGGFRSPGVLVDPTGILAELQAAVSRDFARLPWVRARCEHARRHVLRQLDSLGRSRPFHEQVLGWLFPTGVTTHILLVAGLRNPTVRRRYVEVRQLLAEYGRLDYHERLLGLLGCTRMSRERVAEHLSALTDVYDAASQVASTPFSFSSDVKAVSRPISIDGSRALIDQGLHREAVFWIAVTYSRCQTVLAADAPEKLERFGPAYLDLLGDLDVASSAGLRRRAEQVRDAVPQVWEVAEEIMARNPEIIR